MNDVTLRTFPQNEFEALAMLYIQNQDLSVVTPEELLEKYQETYNQICAYNKACKERRMGLRD